MEGGGGGSSWWLWYSGGHTMIYFKETWMETKIRKLFPAWQAEPAIMIEAISMNITIE